MSLYQIIFLVSAIGLSSLKSNIFFTKSISIEISKGLHFLKLAQEKESIEISKESKDSTCFYFEITQEYPEGVIQSYETKTKVNEIVYAFKGKALGGKPVGKIIANGSECLYGLFKSGGKYDNGGIFSFHIPSSTYKVLYAFKDGESKVGAYNSLHLSSKQKLYGLSFEGGAYHLGTLFVYDLISGDYRILKDFDLTTGTGPSTYPIFLESNKLYGSLSFNGKFGKGSLFEYDLETESFQIIYHFNVNEINTPRSELICADENILFGIANSGGPQHGGGVFAFSIDSQNMECVALMDSLHLSWSDYTFTPINDSTYIGAMDFGGQTKGKVGFSLQLGKSRSIKRVELKTLNSLLIYRGNQEVLKYSEVAQNLNEELVERPVKQK